MLVAFANHLVLEWIPPNDPCARREFPDGVPEDYRFDLLWNAIQPFYEIVQMEALPGSGRRLFLLRLR
jgi:hypothetical protein